MKQDFLIVWRSLRESPRRALFVVANIILGVVVVALIDGYATSMFRGMRDGLVQSGLGHAQIFAAELQEKGNLQSVNVTMSAEAADQALSAVLASGSVIAAAPRLEASVMATNGDASQVGTMIGMDPDAEALISSGLRVTEGRELFADDTGKVLMGAGLSQALELQVGDTLTILGNTLDGILNAADYEIVGIVSTGNRSADARLMYATLDTAQAFLFTQDVTRIAVLLDSHEALAPFLLETAPALPEGTQLHDWRSLEPSFGEVVDLFSAIFLGIKLSISLFVALAVGNTIAICVVERTHEIGMARAMGDQRSDITRRFALEGVALGIVGTIAGLLAALTLGWALNNAGLNMPTPPGATQDYPLRFILTPMNLTLVGTLAIVIAFLASLSPAAKAAKTPITEALRHV